MISLAYLEHIAKSFDNVLTHLHYMMLDILMFQNLNTSPEQCIKFIIMMNLGFLTSSNGWLHAIIHSVKSFFNFS